MNRLQKTLGVGALVLALATGCEQKKPEYVTGTVTQERGTVAQIVESSGALFGNESVKISDPTYVLQIQTPQGLYSASIKESSSKPLDALALAIEEGSRIRVEKGYWDSHFGEDRIGYLYSENIIVDGKE
jgi:hypothetical protein